MRSEGYGTSDVCVSVRSSVTTFSATTRNDTTKQRYQRLNWLHFKNGVSEVMA